MQNFSNLIFASNAACPVAIAPDDRRFQVAAFQHDPIELTSEEIGEIEREVGQFYDYLCTRPANKSKARDLIQTPDRQRIIDTSRPAIDIALSALKEGDMNFFDDMLMTKTELINPRMQLVYDQYRALIEELQETQRVRLSRDDIMTLMRWCVDSVPESPNKFTAMLRHHGVELESLWIQSKTVRGIEIDGWTKVV
jgi:hypothetical protein